jgi:hypothetical protein
VNRFIVATNNANTIQKNAITEVIKNKGWGFWHHFEEFWMVATQDTDMTTSKQLYDELSGLPSIGGQLYMVVMRLPNSPAEQPTFSGFGPKSGWEWTDLHWVKVG